MYVLVPISKAILILNKYRKTNKISQNNTYTFNCFFIVKLF